MRLWILGIALLIIGCQDPQRALMRESMDQATRTIRADHKAWAEKLVADPATGKNRADELPKLTPADYNLILRNHSEYEKLVEEDRANAK